TRSDRDWSSDVCSSDLARVGGRVGTLLAVEQGGHEGGGDGERDRAHRGGRQRDGSATCQWPLDASGGRRGNHGRAQLRRTRRRRSEERRVGKEWRARWW